MKGRGEGREVKVCRAWSLAIKACVENRLVWIRELGVGCSRCSQVSDLRRNRVIPCKSVILRTIQYRNVLTADRVSTHTRRVPRNSNIIFLVRRPGDIQNLSSPSFLCTVCQVQRIMHIVPIPYHTVPIQTIIRPHIKSRKKALLYFFLFPFFFPPVEAGVEFDSDSDSSARVL
jgi:hypothetical protein